MRQRSRKSDEFLFKTGAFVLLAGLAWGLFSWMGNHSKPEQLPADTPSPNPEKPAGHIENKPHRSEIWLPNSTTGVLIRHKHFTLSYHEDHEQAEWVAWELTRKRLNNMIFRRINTFLPDPLVRTESATPNDYRASGYDRGHLCPAADMAFDSVAMSETFYMSNISPQVRGFNAGIWRELEELTRDWARIFGHIYIVTGPVLQTEMLGQIGFSKVSVPKYFYRILLTENGRRAIAFIIPNEISQRPVMDFAVPIDRVEAITKIDFFPHFLKGLDEEIEASIDKSAWQVDEKRFQKRLAEWNNQ